MSLVESYHVARRARLERLGAIPPKPAPIIYSKPAPQAPAPEPQAIDAGWECMWFWDLLRGCREPRQVVPIKEIQAAVCRHYGISILDLISGRRDRKATHSRHVGMYLCRLLTPHSYAEIGRRFGGRDHSTALHGSQKIEGLLGRDIKVTCDVNTLRGVLA